MDGMTMHDSFLHMSHGFGAAVDEIVLAIIFALVGFCWTAVHCHAQQCFVPCIVAL